MLPSLSINTNLNFQSLKTTVTKSLFNQQIRTQVYGTGPGATCFGGPRAVETNSRYIELPSKVQEREQKQLDHPKDLTFAKYPGVVSRLGANYYFRDKLSMMKPGAQNSSNHWKSWSTYHGYGECNYKSEWVNSSSIYRSEKNNQEISGSRNWVSGFKTDLNYSNGRSMGGGGNSICERNSQCDHHDGVNVSYYRMKTRGNTQVLVQDNSGEGKEKDVSKSKKSDSKQIQYEGGIDQVFIGSTEVEKRECKEVQNALYESTRGFAIQLLMEGRGVRIYYDPAYPNLKARLGVGDKGKDLESYVKLDPTVKIEVNKVGSIAVVSGPTKEQVANVAYRLFHKLKKHIYTHKGCKIAFNHRREKTMTKK